MTKARPRPEISKLLSYLSPVQAEAVDRWVRKSSEAASGARRPTQRWRPETDPFRARTLYQMAALGYEARTGQKATPALLNREYPASVYPEGVRRPNAHGSWNLMRLGKHLPRSSRTKQGNAMRRLEERDPAAAEVYDWVLWPLASHQRMTIAQVHGAMVWLHDSVNHKLMGLFLPSRFKRWQTPRLTEVEWMRSTRTIASLVALLALLREAELEQDLVVYERAYFALCEQLPLMDEHPGLSVVAAEFSVYLTERFRQMSYLLPGAYEEEPGSGHFYPVMEKL